MNKLNIQSIEEDRIKIEILDNNEGVLVKFIGDIDMEDPSVILDPLFTNIHEEATGSNIKQVAADFTELNFLNSSGIKAVAKWIMKLTELDNETKYQIKIIHNKDITWQVTSLPTLTFLVPGAVQVE